MTLAFSDLASAIASATPDQIQMLRETVAPVLKLQRYQSIVNDLVQKVQTGNSAAQSIVATFGSQVNSNNLSVGIPTWASIVTAFNAAGPSITVSTSTLNLGTTTAGTPGAAQTYTFSAVNLTADIILLGGTSLYATVQVNAPVGVELSQDGNTWNIELDIMNTTGVFTNVTVYARISAVATSGSLSGNIISSSSEAIPILVAITGVVN